jgi:amino acid permease
MVTATFAYLGTELVGVTVGEAQNPRKSKISESCLTSSY